MEKRGINDGRVMSIIQVSEDGRLFFFAVVEFRQLGLIL